LRHVHETCEQPCSDLQDEQRIDPRWAELSKIKNT